MQHHWQHTPDNEIYLTALADPPSSLDTILGYTGNANHWVGISITISALMENLRTITKQTNCPKLRLTLTHTAKISLAITIRASFTVTEARVS